ncbi:MAG: hypothetical protein K8W52_11135 [Deltaproteobacteria bacterium]|nr:hypothetical protein [Deltaproteobacteria bacterium]
MSRTPFLSAVLWTTIGAASCGGGTSFPDASSIDATSTDATTIDAVVIDAVPPAITFPADLAFTATCGGAAPAVTLEIQNVTAADVTITAADATGGFQVATALPLTIAANSSATIALTPPGAVIGTDRGGQTKVGTLTLTADRGGLPPTVALTSTIIGANLEFVDAAGQPVSATTLTTTDGSCPAPAAVFIHNSGNAPATLSAGGASHFTQSFFSPSSIVAGGETITHNLGLFTLGPCSGSDTLTYFVQGQVCAPDVLAMPASYNITGTSSCFCS